jgi:hypothetical protein
MEIKAATEVWTTEKAELLLLRTLLLVRDERGQDGERLKRAFCGPRLAKSQFLRARIGRGVAGMQTKARHKT